MRYLYLTLALVLAGCACKPVATLQPARVGVSCWAAR